MPSVEVTLNKLILAFYQASKKNDFKREFGLQNIYQFVRDTITVTDKAIANYLKTLYQNEFLEWRNDQTSMFLTDKLMIKGEELQKEFDLKLNPTEKVEEKKTDETGFFKY